MCEEKRGKICLIPARPHLFNPIVAGGKAGNAVNSGTMDKFFPACHLKSINKAAGRNEKQADFTLFNLGKGFYKALK
ncbi:MAG: hypothetical protein IIB95_14345 [Candidatus Marinimicrobia bacterium]|nr:hypothetical protein [Candidatus Neomarinimicrobiota bacterium]